MPNNMRTDLPFSTDIPAYETTEPNHASRFNERGNQLASNDAYLKSEQDKIKQAMQEGLPAKGGDADTVDGCHAGNNAGNVLKIGADGKVPEGNLTHAVKRWWKSSTQYAVGDVVEPLTIVGNFRAICTASGQSSTSTPAWTATDGASVQDGSVTWKMLDLRNADTLGGHGAGTGAGNVLVLSSGAKVPHAVLDFLQNNRIVEQFLNGAAKQWWKPSTNYVVGNVIKPLGALNGQVYKCIQAGTSGAVEPAWPTDDYSEFTDGGVKWRSLSPESQSGSVGDIRFPAMSVKPNEIKLNGALLLRESYPELWAFAQTTSIASDIDYLNNGYWGKFSTGDGSTTFRLPDMRGVFLRVMAEGRTATDPDGHSRSIGQAQGDAIRNMYGRIGMALYTNVYVASGPFYYAVSEGDGRSSSGGNRGVVDFNASRQVPTGGDNRPINLPYYAVIRYK